MTYSERVYKALTEFLIQDAGRSNTEYHNTINDCSVIALAIAMNISYIDAHQRCMLAGRKTGQGFFLDSLAKAYGWEKVPFPVRNGQRRETVHTAAKLLGAGRYILRMTLHYVSAVDGVPCGDQDTGDKCVYFAWKVKL